MSKNKEFEETVGDWESHDDWKFADKEAERRYFFEAGHRKGMEEAYLDIAKTLHTAYGDNDVSKMYRAKADATREEISHD